VPAAEGGATAPEPCLPAGSLLRLVRMLGQWRSETLGRVTDRDALRFGLRLFEGEPVDRHGLRHCLREIERTSSSFDTQRARAFYLDRLRDGRSPDGGPRGVWVPDPAVTTTALAAALHSLDEDPGALVVKRAASSSVVRISGFLGREVFVKRYEVRGAGRMIRSLWAASRARRAWAASNTLSFLGVPTPEPLGFFEEHRPGEPRRSYFVTAAVRDGLPMSRWLRRHYPSLPAGERVRLRAGLLGSLLSLYHRGLYHADTKTQNLLVAPAGDPGERTLLWTDLEHLRPGSSPTRRQIVRNLVQLNGSLRRHVPESDRIAFLRVLARRYPWLLAPSVSRRIRSWTRRRLLKEARTRCGS
jgi:hypothetical protein